eukprot:6173817-Pleurochrysis_carterae.AAC.1
MSGGEKWKGMTICGRDWGRGEEAQKGAEKGAGVKRWQAKGRTRERETGERWRTRAGRADKRSTD